MIKQTLHIVSAYLKYFHNNMENQQRTLSERMCNIDIIGVNATW